MSNYPDYVYGIKVDYSRDELFSKSGLTRLKDGYMKDDEVSPQQRFAYVAASFGSDLAHAQRLYDYASKMWLSFSTPILSYGKTSKSLPISCYASYLGDSIRSILDTSSETRMMAVVGGGVGLHVNLRPGDKKSSGIIPHLKTYDMDTLAFKQGTTRRGATAAYLDINHPEIIEFLEMRKPTGGDPNRKCLNIHHGINITDDFMSRVEKLSNKDLELTLEEKEELDRFPLINKHTGEIVEYVSVKELWSRILTIRMEQGEPYIWFIDTANAGLPEYQKKLGLKNHGSNLCLTGDTTIEVLINDSDKSTKIQLDELVERFNSGTEEFKVLSGKHREFNYIIDVAKTGTTKELIEIKDLLNDNIIRCTPDHEILSGKRGFVKAKYLNENYDTVYLSNGQLASFMMKTVILDHEIPVYDITVDKDHSFFANNILVHNCSEISLATNDDRTFVCCLSSVNCEKYDDWKNDEKFIPDVVEMLDNVIEVFIKDASEYDELKKAVYSASRERAIGIGMLGWHAYLQSKMISFESPMAVGLNKKIWKTIKEQAREKSIKLGEERGPCLDSIGSGEEIRNSHVLSLAPNSSSSSIMGTSPSCEPYRANVYLEKGVNGTIVHNNRYLEQLLKEKEKNTPDVWSDIIANDGSVQHLGFLSDYEKGVFKTAIELDQAWVIQHASDRQEYICQAQSVNLFFNPEVSIEYLHLIHLMAWKAKLKGLYYCRSDALRKADKVGKTVERERIEIINKLVHQEEEICLACQ